MKNCSFNGNLSTAGQSASIIAIIIQKDEKENGEWSALGSVHFASGIHWIGGWTGPTADLKVVARKKSLPLLKVSPL
jgi:hypothetical protein